MDNLLTKNHCTSLEAIEQHYNIGNDFYRLWLGKTMAYSGALWKEEPSMDSLDLAQIRKVDFHIQQARGEGTNCVLDIGCGWGLALQRMTQVHQVKEAVGLTLSSYQKVWIEALHIPRTRVHLESWLDHSPNKPYGAIISIGAFEHFARMEASVKEKIKGYQLFFTKCHEWLKPGGRMSLQTIACGNMRPEDYHSFVAKEIFPETALPRLSEIAEASESQFEIIQLHNDPEGYVLTLRSWIKALKLHRREAVALVGEELVARYDRFLKITLLAFEIGANQLLRLTLRRIDKPNFLPGVSLSNDEKV